MLSRQIAEAMAKSADTIKLPNRGAREGAFLSPC